MGGTKIVVFQMRQIVKVGLIALGGLLALILLILLLTPNAPTASEGDTYGGTMEDAGSTQAAEEATGSYAPIAYSAKYVPGTYTAQIILHNHAVDVFVTVDAQSITDVALAELPESEALFYPLFQPTMALLAPEIVELQSTDIAVAEHMAITSKVLLSAIDAALEQAQYSPVSTEFH